MKNRIFKHIIENQHKEKEDHLEIIPGIKLGKYRLDWDLDTLKNNLPDDYQLCYDDKKNDLWGIQINNCYIAVSKIDCKIISIQVWSPFKEYFNDKLKCGSTVEEVEAEFGPVLYQYGPHGHLSQYPGMELEFQPENEDEDEDEDMTDEEAEESWKKYRLYAIFIYGKEPYIPHPMERPWPFPKKL